MSNNEDKIVNIKVKEKDFDILKKYFKSFSSYEDEIKELRGYQKETIEKCVNELKAESLSKKEVKRIFNYLKKGIEPSELREEASVLDEIKRMLNSEWKNNRITNTVLKRIKRNKAIANKTAKLIWKVWRRVTRRTRATKKFSNHWVVSE